MCVVFGIRGMSWASSGKIEECLLARFALRFAELTPSRCRGSFRLRLAWFLWCKVPSSTSYGLPSPIFQTYSATQDYAQVWIVLNTVAGLRLPFCSQQNSSRRFRSNDRGVGRVSGLCPVSVLHHTEGFSLRHSAYERSARLRLVPFSKLYVFALGPSFGQCRSCPSLNCTFRIPQNLGVTHNQFCSRRSDCRRLLEAPSLQN